jgi:acetyltransferase-like isoleucine patch superfamily enzyme
MPPRALETLRQAAVDLGATEIDMGSPLLHFYLLHYKQQQYLPPLLAEAARFDPARVAFELRDDGSPPAVQEEVRRMLAAHPSLKSTLFEKNRGVVGMLEGCLADTRAPYTYIGASDDAACSAILNEIVGRVAPGETPFIVSDFYSLEEQTGTSVLTEAVVPQALRLRGKLSPKEFRREVEAWPLPTYMASHALLCPTQLHREAGGYPTHLAWHADWFAFTVAALRSEVRYSHLPIACWRHSTGTYSHAGTQSAAEIEILRRVLLTLLEPRYADVRDHVMAPHLGPWVPNVGRQMLRAILPRPRLWRFLRAGHFRRALAECLAPLTERGRVLGKLIRFTDFLPAFRAFIIATILRLAGATVGRRVRFGKKFRVSQPRGLVIEDGVIFGDHVSLFAPHPVVIGRGAVVEDGVRIESENKSRSSPVPFIRRKSVLLGAGCRVGAGTRLGPGAVVAAGENVPARSEREDVEERPLYYMNQAQQLCVDHEVLATYCQMGSRAQEQQP